MAIYKDFMRLSYFFLIILLSVLLDQAFSNEESASDELFHSTIQNSTQATNNSLLAKGFNGINLGASLEEVKSELKESALFNYIEREIPSLSLFESRILTVEGDSYINYAYFLFSEDNTLHSFSLFLDTNRLDYSTLYQVFEGKYGRPLVSVNKSVWSNGITSIILEKPLQIKYLIEKQIVNNVPRDENSEFKHQSRQKFLELF